MTNHDLPPEFRQPEEQPILQEELPLEPSPPPGVDPPVAPAQQPPSEPFLRRS